MIQQQQQQQKIGIIYHANCIDGFTAYWAADWSLKREGCYDITALAIDYNTPIAEAEMLADAVDLLYVLDFSFSSLDILYNLTKRSGRLVLLDHHEKAFENLSGSKPIVYDGVWNHYTPTLTIELNNHISGAAMTWKHFNPGAEMPALIKYVSDYDTWQYKYGDNTRYINRVLSAAPKTLAEWDGLYHQMEDSVTPGGLHALLEQGRAVQNYHLELVAAAVKQAAPITIAGVQGLATNCSIELASDVGHELAKRSGTFGAVWQQQVGPKGNTVKWSLRSTSTNLCNVNELASKFGGGGHACAAGFYLYPESMQGDVQLWATGSDEEESE